MANACEKFSDPFEEALCECRNVTQTDGTRLKCYDNTVLWRRLQLSAPQEEMDQSLGEFMGRLGFHLPLKFLDVR